MKRRHLLSIANILIWGRLAFHYIWVATTQRRISWLIMGLLISFIPVLIVAYMMKADSKDKG